MKLESFLISLFVVTGVVLGFYAFASDMAGQSGYDVTINDSYSEQFEETESLGTELNESLNELTNSELGVTDVVQAIGLGWKVMKIMVKTPVVFIRTIIYGTFTEIEGIPDWVIAMVFSIVTILLIFAFIALLLRFKP